jgi:hypothetical protein
MICDADQREESIKHHMSYCQHYDGPAMTRGNGQCKAGIDYRVKFGSEPGMFNRMPCVNGQDKFPDPCVSCDKWLRVTREQAEQEEAEWAVVLNRITVVMPAINAWRDKPPRGKQETIVCPSCGGKLHLAQSSYNGHVSAKCETTDCVELIE